MDQIWYNQWKDDRSKDKIPIDWSLFEDNFRTVLPTQVKGSKGLSFQQFEARKYDCERVFFEIYSTLQVCTDYDS